MKKRKKCQFSGGVSKKANHSAAKLPSQAPVVEPETPAVSEELSQAESKQPEALVQMDDIETDMDEEMIKVFEEQHGTSAVTPEAALAVVKQWLVTDKGDNSLYSSCQKAKEDSDDLVQVLTEALQMSVVRFHVVGCEGVDDAFWAITGGAEDPKVITVFTADRSVYSKQGTCRICASLLPV
mmetsp:Transcript_27263/g.53603  ORF Transcript_27263/g.53603 Transcript_27263/m.53603 type:complete len:182 (+) Transcript_27263:34-579(+)